MNDNKTYVKPSEIRKAVIEDLNEAGDLKASFTQFIDGLCSKDGFFLYFWFNYIWSPEFLDDTNMSEPHFQQMMTFRGQSLARKLVEKVQHLLTLLSPADLKKIAESATFYYNQRSMRFRPSQTGQSQKLIAILVLLMIVQSAESSHYKCGFNVPTLRNCTVDDSGIQVEINSFLINGMTVLDINQVRVRDYEDPSGEEEGFLCKSLITNQVDLKCMKACLGNGTQLSCTGDTQYCDSHSCANFASCDCRLVKYNREMECKVEHDWKACHDGKKYTALVSFAKLKETSRKRYSQSIVMFVQMIDSSILLEFKHSSDIPGTLLITKDAHTMQQTVTELETLVKLPQEFLLTSGEITIKYLSEEGEFSETQIQYKAKYTCYIPDCYMCYSMIEHFTCLPNFQKLFVIVVFLWCFSSIILMMSSIIYWCKTILKCLLIYPYRCCRCCIKRANSKLKVTHKFHELREVVQAEILDKTPTNQNLGASRRNITDFNPFSGSQPYLQIILILGFLSLALGCSDTITVSSLTDSCTINGSDRVCRIKLEGQVTLNYPGQKVCLIGMDEDNNQDLRVQIKLNKVYDVASPSILYYTSDWYGIYGSKIYCFGQTGCNWDTYCTVNYQTRSDKISGVEWSSELLNWPGAATCDSKPGGWPNGCFSYEDKCNWSIFSLIPSGIINEVLRVGTRTIHPVLEIKIINARDGNEISSETVSATGEWTTINGVSVKMEGFTVGTRSDLSKVDLIYDGMDSWFHETSQRNDPTRQTVGDIQADEISDFTIMSRDSFIYAKESVTKLIGHDATTYQFDSSGINQLELADKLPVIYNGDIWTFDGSILKADMSDPGTLIISFRTPDWLSITREENLICPEGHFVEASGCYKCQEGAKVVVEMSSTCETGSISVGAKNQADIIVRTTSIVLSKEKEMFDIWISTSSEDNNFIMTFKSTHNQIDIPIAFKAVLDVRVRNDSVIRDDHSTNILGSIGDFFNRIFNSTGGMTETIIFWIVFGLVCLGLIIVVPLVINKFTGYLASIAESGRKLTNAVRRGKKD
jgi:hypothetical protein